MKYGILRLLYFTDIILTLQAVVIQTQNCGVFVTWSGQQVPPMPRSQVQGPGPQGLRGGQCWYLEYGDQNSSN